MFANRAIYHEGWIASCFHGRAPWVRSQKLEVDGPQEKWELYNIAKISARAVDLASNTRKSCRSCGTSSTRRLGSTTSTR